MPTATRDDIDVLAQAKRALSADYQLFIAANGPQALRVCREQQPDLVLLDVVMPDMDGLETLAKEVLPQL